MNIRELMNKLSRIDEADDGTDYPGMLPNNGTSSGQGAPAEPVAMSAKSTSAFGPANDNMKSLKDPAVTLSEPAKAGVATNTTGDPKIQALQTFLNNNFRSGLNPDGKMGPRTIAALNKITGQGAAPSASRANQAADTSKTYTDVGDANSNAREAARFAQQGKGTTAAPAATKSGEMSMADAQAKVAQAGGQPRQNASQGSGWSAQAPASSKPPGMRNMQR